MRKLLLLAIVSTTIFQCTNKKENTNDNSINSSPTYNDYSSEEGDETLDGIYCARVDYYFYKTRTSSYYTLDVKVEDGELTEIHWPNGGWLDNTHFSSTDISDGTANFTSYEGVNYEVRIVGNQGDCILSSYAVDEDQLIRNYKRNKREEEENEQVQQDLFDQQLQDEIERQRMEEEEEEAEEDEGENYN